MSSEPEAVAQQVTPFSPLPLMHASIVKALCKVQASIEAVPKSQHNRHGNYNYASADDIYAAVTRKLGEAGLVIYPLELTPVEIKRVEISSTDREGNVEKKTAQWGKFHFGYALMTEEATWFDPRSAQSLLLQILGPQSHNAAESYAQKTYLRALLKLPTGDMDLDSLPQADTEEDQMALNANGKGKRKSSAEGKRDGSVKTFNEIRAKVMECKTADMLQQVRTLYAEEWNTLPRAWAETLSEDYEVKLSEFGVQDAAE